MFSGLDVQLVESGGWGGKQHAAKACLAKKVRVARTQLSPPPWPPQDNDDKEGPVWPFVFDAGGQVCEWLVRCSGSGR
jgi:hypothetical protein